MIEIRNISKTYPASNKKANNNISLDLHKGEILCIAGENGAGKTTLMKILAGLEKQDEGKIEINGQIGMVHQHFMLFPEYTAAENIVLGAEPLKWNIFLDLKKANEIAQEIIKKNNFSIKSTAKVKDLTLGEMQQVEICRVLNRNADIIILDEPTSILTELETQSLFNYLKMLSSTGKSIILITHKLNEIKNIADRAAVLKNGELVGIINITEDTDEEKIAKMMIGSNNHVLFNQFKKNEPNIKKDDTVKGEPVIEFNCVTVKRKNQKRPLLDNVSFNVRAGEILGFAGVGGNGLGVIEAVLGGFLHPESGKVLYKGKDISNYNSHDLRRLGLAYVPADRKKVGSAQDATIEENMIINERNEYFKTRINRKQRDINSNYIDIKNRKEKVSILSGGNLQKLILQREIKNNKDYIVFSEPTWGLDIASEHFIAEEIEKIRSNGAAVILISTNLDEILQLSNRIIVMYKGKIASVYDNDGNEKLKEKIGMNMSGLGI